MKKRLRKPCSRLWRTFTVLASGDVALCCLDYDGQQILGRVDESHSIREVWNAEPYRDIRRCHREARQSESGCAPSARNRSCDKNSLSLWERGPIHE